MAIADPIVPETSLDSTGAPFAAPTLECDVVMKGGITSGVVYPLAVCELAKTYRFRCIGGTSAGAIAAAATAAAEYGRRNGGDGGFPRLAELPGWLGESEEGADRSHLFALFQPELETDSVFDVATASLLGRSVPGRLITRFPGWALLGLLPGAAVAWLGTQARPLAAAAFLVLVGVLLAGAGALGLAGWMLARRVRKVLPQNGFGLCSGNGPDVDDALGRPPALTPWLADLINRLAGKPREDGPLTFGDLWDPPHPDGEPMVDLRFMTTSVTHGRPYEFPFASRLFYYDPEEFGKLFPAWVMKGMDAAALTIKQANAAQRAQDAAAGKPVTVSTPAAQAQWDRLLPLPEPKDLPVVVGARMSLSFPVLFSAVPLYAVDFGRDIPEEERAPERCWFSDGGICSNFPVHFFDTPLPVRPTFGINLRPFPLGQAPDEADQFQNVWLPLDNNDGHGEVFTRIDERAGWKALAGFAGGIITTMQNWVDNTQLRVPGYRDRVAHVMLTETEGGLNLNMPARAIRDLGARGQRGARELARRFDPVNAPADTPLTWDNHRWVRFRSSLQLLEELLRDVGAQYRLPDVGGRTYADLVLRGNDDLPGSYRLRSAKRARTMDQALSDVQALAFLQGKPLFEKGAPKPTPEIRIRPRL